MAKIELHPDFKDFLRLLNSHEVRYILVGGYAVGYHGYPRPTADLDVWIAMTPENGKRLANVLVDFGFGAEGLSGDEVTKARQIIRMGLPPVRIEVLTTISGVDFQPCYDNAVDGVIDGVQVKIISRDDLRRNKRASGRHKDLDDLEHL